MLQNLFTLSRQENFFLTPYSHNLWKTLSEAPCTTILPPESAIIHPTDRPRETDWAINLEIEGALIKQIQREGRPVVLGVLGQTAMCMGYLSQLVVQFSPQYFKWLMMHPPT